MDLLLTPRDPSFPVEATPYVCEEHWDGGPFLTYAQRKGMTSMISPTLREQFPSLGPYDPYSEGHSPTPQKEKEAFYQTWLFFGLLAEFLGLNPNERGDRIVVEAAAQKGIQALYDNYTFVEPGSGQRYVKIGKEEFLPLVPLVVGRVRKAKYDIESYVRHLRDCLHLTWLMVHNISNGVSESVHFSISALGELLNIPIWQGVLLKQSEFPTLQVYPFPWSRAYVEPGSEIERKMKKNGWCPSEIEKIRSLYQGLNTVHYLSRLKRASRSGGGQAHTSCTVNRCEAFEVDLSKYKPSHRNDGCKCDLVGIDMEELLDILKSKNTYPLLRLDFSGGRGVKPTLLVEPYRPGIPYVAISHVWADGLGNPHENTLHLCQIERVAELIASLQEKTYAADNIRAKVIRFIRLVLQVITKCFGYGTRDLTTYRFWIDPLLCPVEEKWKTISLERMKEGKKISLERIADVYRNATHVLVLDSTLYAHHAQSMEPAELLLRVIGTSTWMRRLWTFQEGVLAQSIYFQFADGPVNVMDLLPNVFRDGFKDPRYTRIWMDLSTEVRRLRSFFNPNNQPESLILTQLHYALYFRTATVAADEAICIANLLGLDVNYVLAVADAQKRMARVWQLIARKNNGHLPAHLVFSVEDTLTLHGWRWAPRTLMSAQVEDSAMSIDARASRFITEQSGEPHLATQELEIGTATPLCQGLRVQFPGYLLKVHPRHKGLPLHPWEGVLSRHWQDQIPQRGILGRHWKGQIIIQDKAGKMMHVTDWKRTQKLSRGSLKELEDYDLKAASPLCKAFDEYQCVLVVNPTVTAGVQRGFLAKLEEEVVPLSNRSATSNDGKTPHSQQPPSSSSPSQKELRVCRQMTVTLSELDQDQTFVAKELQALADRIASEKVIQDLVTLREKHGSSPEYEAALDMTRDRMKELMVEVWSSNREFAEAVRRSQGSEPTLESLGWAFIPHYFSHVVEYEELPPDQVWIVD